MDEFKDKFTDIEVQFNFHNKVMDNHSNALRRFEERVHENQNTMNTNTQNLKHGMRRPRRLWTMSTTLSKLFFIADTIQDLLAPRALIPQGHMMIPSMLLDATKIHTTIMWIFKDNINLKTHTTIMWMLKDNHRHKERHLMLLKVHLNLKKDKATLMKTP